MTRRKPTSARLGQAAADRPLDGGRVALAHEGDDDGLLARALELVREGDRAQEQQREVAQLRLPDRLLVEETGARSGVALEERLDARWIVDPLGARAEARLDHDPAEAGDVQAGVRLDLRCHPGLELVAERLQLRPGIRLLHRDALSPEEEIGLGCGLELGEHAGGDAQASCLLQRPEHVPGRARPRCSRSRAAPPRRCPTSRRSRSAIRLAAGDDVVERALEDVRRGGPEARRRIPVEHAALAVVVLLPRELLAEVPAQRARDPPARASVDEPGVVLDEPFHDLGIEVLPAVGACTTARSLVAQASTRRRYRQTVRGDRAKARESSSPATHTCVRAHPLRRRRRCSRGRALRRAVAARGRREYGPRSPPRGR